MPTAACPRPATGSHPAGSRGRSRAGRPARTSSSRDALRAGGGRRVSRIVAVTKFWPGRLGAAEMSTSRSSACPLASAVPAIGRAAQRTAARGRERSRAGATRRRACRLPRPPRPGAAASTVAGGARRAIRAARGCRWRPPMRAWRGATSRRSSRAGHRDSQPGARRCRAR